MVFDMGLTHLDLRSPVIVHKTKCYITNNYLLDFAICDADLLPIRIFSGLKKIYNSPIIMSSKKYKVLSSLNQFPEITEDGKLDTCEFLDAVTKFVQLYGMY